MFVMEKDHEAKHARIKCCNYCVESLVIGLYSIWWNLRNVFDSALQSRFDSLPICRPVDSCSGYPSLLFKTTPWKNPIASQNGDAFSLQQGDRDIHSSETKPLRTAGFLHFSFRFFGASRYFWPTVIVGEFLLKAQTSIALSTASKKHITPSGL